MTLLESERVYHIYNRANGSEVVFADDGNYDYFLKQYRLHLEPYVITYWYCLMPNHFHLLIRVRDENEILEAMRLGGEKTFPKFQTLEKLVRERDAARFEYIGKIISRQFASFFSGYTQAFNKQQNRMGSLFMKNYKRKLVLDQLYLKKLVYYIHLNPVVANLCKSPVDWKYSSYTHIINDTSDLVERDEVFDWFDDLNNFGYFHTLSPMLSKI